MYEVCLMAGTGMDEGDDLFVFVIKSLKKCGLWFGINFLIVIFVFIIIGLFENVIL